MDNMTKAKKKVATLSESAQKQHELLTKEVGRFQLGTVVSHEMVNNNSTLLMQMITNYRDHQREKTKLHKAAYRQKVKEKKIHEATKARVSHVLSSYEIEEQLAIIEKANELRKENNLFNHRLGIN
jgi:hypothetical protein